MKMPLSLQHVVLLPALLFSGVSSAALVTYTDRTAWEAAVSGIVTEDLNSVVSDVDFSNSSTTVGALTFSHAGAGAEVQLDAPLVSLPGSTAAGVDGTTLLDIEPLPGGQSIGVDLGGSFLAFGVDYINYDNSADRAELFVNGMSIGLTDLDVNQGALGFLGVVASPDMAFSSVEIGNATGGSLFHGFDNFSVANAAGNVPAPATLALIALGALGALGMRRRARASA